ncbi:MAG TPA: ABC transporter substrate-binding protein [Pseudolabrys sp.]|nr:ABC transporter substrate-binding protein [Pseudolabrys sp.]
MRRRDFIKVIAGLAAAWPLAGRAQQSDRLRRIGVLFNRAESDPEGQARLLILQQTLQQLGWRDGGNVRLDIRWGEDDVEHHRRYAAELVALEPDVVIASGTLSVTALQRISRSLPIVFVGVTDPVGAGVVNSLAHPGGNVTGFMIYEYSLGGKWLEILKQIAPSVTRVAVLRDATNPAGIALFGAIQAVAQSLGVQASPVGMQDAGEIERAITTLAQSPNAGVIVTPSASASAHRDVIVALAAKYKMPAIYYRRYFVDKGGLMSYGHDDLQQYRDAAGYVDRILKGDKPGDLPVQAPTKYELVVNLKTAKTLSLSVPPALLARADEVIE